MNQNQNQNINQNQNQNQSHAGLVLRSENIRCLILSAPVTAG